VSIAPSAKVAKRSKSEKGLSTRSAPAPTAASFHVSTQKSSKSP
jgi:hypothetical protein